MKLDPGETELVGSWSLINGTMKPDAVTQRIEQLLQHHLTEIGADESGWDVLYRDPVDGRLWELTYPVSDTHGSGPPTLKTIDSSAAQAKYKALKSSL
jgi:hypothetical protein